MATKQAGLKAAQDQLAEVVAKVCTNPVVDSDVRVLSARYSERQMKEHGERYMNVRLGIRAYRPVPPCQ